MNIFKSLIIALLLISCSTQEQEPISLDNIAEDFVILCHSIKKYDADFVDAYFGPDSLKTIGEKSDSTLQNIKSRSIALFEILDSVPETEIEKQNKRKYYLQGQLQAMNARINYLLGYPESFKNECKKIYKAQLPKIDESEFDKILVELEKALPGEGDLNTRINNFKSKLVIDKSLLDTVFQAALNETRKRTKVYFDFDENEGFNLNYVTDKPWSGYNWFQGGNNSNLEISIDFPIYIDRAIDLAAHEAYPGHHTFHSTYENKFVKELGWVEFSIYPLFSPISLISEGSANYGIQVAFPDEEKLKFEKEVLYPLANLDTSLAEKFDQIQYMTKKLSYAGNIAAQRLLDSEFTEEEAVTYLMKYVLMTEERAKQRVKFIQKYRSYVINYNLGMDLISNYVESELGDGDDKQRWQIFKELISTPVFAEDLMTEDFMVF